MSTGVDVNFAGVARIQNLPAPVALDEPVRLRDLQNAIAGLSWKERVVASSIVNVAITGLPTMDGIGPILSGQRVLLLNNTNPVENGIWVTAVGAWTRPVDFPIGGGATNAAVFVAEGTARADTAWVCTDDPGNDVIGTDQLTFVQFSGGAASNRPTLADKRLTPAASAGVDAFNTTLALAAAPIGYCAVNVNGIIANIAQSNAQRTTSDGYFSADGGVTALAQGALTAGAVLFWNPTVAGYNITTAMFVDFLYNVAADDVLLLPLAVAPLAHAFSDFSGGTQVTPPISVLAGALLEVDVFVESGDAVTVTPTGLGCTFELETSGVLFGIAVHRFRAEVPANAEGAITLSITGAGTGGYSVRQWTGQRAGDNGANAYVYSRTEAAFDPGFNQHPPYQRDENRFSLACWGAYAAPWIGDTEVSAAVDDGSETTWQHVIGPWRQQIGWATSQYHIGVYSEIASASAPETAWVNVSIPQTPVASARRAFFAGHSLVNHEAISGLLSVTPNETAIMHWMHLFAVTNSVTWTADGQYGLLRSHADVAFAPAWSFAVCPTHWNGGSGTFADQNFDVFVLAPENWIQHRAPSAEFEDAIGSGETPISESTLILNYLASTEPTATAYIYEGWPNMSRAVSARTWVGEVLGAPPTQEELGDYFSEQIGQYQQWMRDYQDALVAAVPTLNIKLLPVGSILAKLLWRTELNTVPSGALYEDNAPHGRENLYFLAGLITYMSLYRCEPGAIAFPASIHPVISANYAAIKAYIWAELQTFVFPGGASRVF
jgi:hypothetical protein